MHPAKRASVEALPGPERFSYFVRKVADFEKVWGLFHDGWATAADSAGRKVMPLWPEAEFAAAAAIGAWSGYQPAAIELSDFVDKWVAGMTKDSMLAGVFPTSLDKGIVVAPEALRDALLKESAQYE